ncbi:hypothetical protein DBT_0628 [Dissulfuribacter thermophilus]|uniref:Thioredoxin n=1 Tax=Dissulfuribacter thermophilus TaxID=1156395 RepID=A0A1B9F8C1_9BACT|nr:hypothetical protein DBT_0628 [Dissulfuribacter thermophilus]
MKRYFPYIIFILSILFIFVGIFTGEASSIYKKAIAICLSCIGIG